jgi:hypothetical protein
MNKEEMPADIVDDRIIMSQQQECVTLMDDYGSMFKINILLSQASTRSAQITDAQTVMTTNESSVVGYAAQAGFTLPAALTLAQKQALYTQQTGNVPSLPSATSAPPVTEAATSTTTKSSTGTTT